MGVRLKLQADTPKSRFGPILQRCGIRAETSSHPPGQLDHPVTPRLAAAIKSGASSADLISG
jgi:hypothetical protein